jgi:hypothetical protein
MQGMLFNGNVPPPPLPPQMQGMLINGSLPYPPPPGYIPPPLIVTDVIPQPKLSQYVPVASSLMTQPLSSFGTESATVPMVIPAPISLSFTKPTTNISSLKSLKGGLTLVFDPQSEGPDEMSMEEFRAAQPRYQNMMARAVNSTA